MLGADSLGQAAAPPPSLHIPALEPGTSTLTAALAYAKAGWYLLPVNPRDKSPGGRVGKGWPSKSSRDPEQLAAWFAGTSDLLALHVGRSGAVVFDVDDAQVVPEALAPTLTDPAVPFQSSREKQPGRGHYAYALPPGREFGNGKRGLHGPWGEVRGRNGVIIVAPPKHASGDGRPLRLASGRPTAAAARPARRGACSSARHCRAGHRR